MIFVSVIDLQQTRQNQEQVVESMFRMIGGLSVREACRMFKVTRNQKIFFQKCIKPMAKPKNCDIHINEQRLNLIEIKIVSKKINEFNEEDFK